MKNERGEGSGNSSWLDRVFGPDTQPIFKPMIQPRQPSPTPNLHPRGFTQLQLQPGQGESPVLTLGNCEVLIRHLETLEDLELPEFPLSGAAIWESLSHRDRAAQVSRAFAWLSFKSTSPSCTEHLPIKKYLVQPPDYLEKVVPLNKLKGFATELQAGTIHVTDILGARRRDMEVVIASFLYTLSIAFSDIPPESYP